MALTIKEEQKKGRKKGGQGNKGRTSKKKTTTKTDTKLAKGLKKVYPGIAGGDSTLELLRRLQINPKDLVDGKYKHSGKG